MQTDADVKYQQRTDVARSCRAELLITYGTSWYRRFLLLHTVKLLSISATVLLKKFILIIYIASLLSLVLLLAFLDAKHRAMFMTIFIIIAAESAADLKCF